MSRPLGARLPASRVLSHLALLLAVAVALGVVVAGLALPFAGVAGVAARNAADTVADLPAELEVGDLAQKTRILDGSGVTIATLYDENRINVPLKTMSRSMVKAIVAIEDYRFYQHGALDLKGTLRALVTNQASSGVVQGGSSITQQLVKLTLLDQAKNKKQRAAATDDTYARKLRELRYAIALEQEHSKDWILERYLNAAYFGDGAFGVQAAARHYFGVNAKDLDVKQSATLAGLVKNPTGYDPTNSPDRALARRNVVLDRMAELGAISSKRAERIKERDLGLRIRRSANGCVESAAPFFCDYVVNYLLADKSLGKTVEERRSLLRSGGLTIRTTVDLTQQAAADAAVAAHVDPTDQAIGGLAIVEARTGAVKALAQSRPMGRDRKAGETFINYVVPQEYGKSQCCQAGSTFKPFTLAAAINAGIPLTKTFNAAPTMTFDLSDYANCEGEPNFAGTWEVSNATTSGTKNLYEGTRESVNTFYAQLERETGVCAPFELATEMGVRLTNPAGDKYGNGAERVPTFTLGVAGVSPLEMAEAYATFAGRGLHCDSRPVIAIEDTVGNLLKSYDPRCTQVLPQSTADAVSDVLRGVIEGGFASAQRLSVPAAGKTGTTQDGKSVWFVGYTSQLAAAAMIGGANELGTPIPLTGQVIGGTYITSASGSGFAAPIWGDALKVIDDSLDYVDFVKPSSTDVAGILTTVPETAGMTLEQAQQALADAGFTTALGGFRDSEYAKGNVAFTSPPAGTQLPGGTRITIFQSDGSPKGKGKGGGGKKGDGGRGGGGGKNNGGR